MSLSRETENRLQDAIVKMTKGFITAEETRVTDFHINVNNGEFTIMDDDDNCLARVHIFEWENEQIKTMLEAGFYYE